MEVTFPKTFRLPINTSHKNVQLFYNVLPFSFLYFLGVTISIKANSLNRFYKQKSILFFSSDCVIILNFQTLACRNLKPYMDKSVFFFNFNWYFFNGPHYFTISRELYLNGVKYSPD